MPSFLHIQFQVAETQHKLAYTKRKSLAPITKKFRFFNFSHSLIQEVKYHQDSLLPQICLLPVSSILSHVFPLAGTDDMAENVGSAWLICLLWNNHRDQEHSWMGSTWVTCSPLTLGGIQFYLNHMNWAWWEGMFKDRGAYWVDSPPKSIVLIPEMHNGCWTWREREGGKKKGRARGREI